MTNWEQLKKFQPSDIIAWAEDQSWCHAMMNCQQDANWHAEGDVWTHTKMVLAELVNLKVWRSLSPHEQQVLTFTALFHDAAKPLTTVTDQETGHIRSPRHAVKGEHLVRRILRELGCDLQTREEVARMVRFHGRPAFLLERDDPIHEVVRLSWLVNNRLLYWFAIADSRGRYTETTSRPEENLHYWREQAEELKCFDRPFAFATEHARFSYFRQQQPNLHYVPHEDFSCKVTVVCGLPGSGKDTWLNRYRSELPVVALDEIRKEQNIEPTDNQGLVIQHAKERCREYMRSGISFAFNATNILHQTRKRWLDLFSNYNARIELVYLEPPFDQILAQNKNRRQAVPESVIQKLADKCEPPTWLETHTLVIM